MSKIVLFVAVLSGTALFLARTGLADIPAPPVNQTVGMMDSSMGNLTEAGCRVCHSTGLPNRHHLLYGQPIPPGSPPPYPDADGNGPDTTYSCVSCHGTTFALVRNCAVCHTGSSPHHTTAAAMSGDCKSCHGSIVDNRNDGHYIPTYLPSLVTPSPSGGDGLPLNSDGKGAGACNYCHDEDNASPHVILSNDDLHHDTGFGSDFTKCAWCHDFGGGLAPIRTCEGCHGPDSLHNIQADSPASANIGTIVVGGENAGYGHVGRDAGPGNSDCWGCHGFAFAFAPRSGPVIPTVYSSDRTVVTAGTDTMVVLTGAAFTNTIGNTLYEADVRLTAANGSSVTLTPDLIIDEGMLAVTIPGITPPGNYDLQALKADFRSNPAAISVVPQVKITRATYTTSRGKTTVTITGSGFGGYAAGSGTSVTGAITTGRTTKTVSGAVVSWADSKIVASFSSQPNKVTVKSIFGSATTSKVTKR